jgi:hypothetical protein
MNRRKDDPAARSGSKRRGVRDYVPLVADLPLAVAPASLTGMIEHPALPVSRKWGC